MSKENLDIRKQKAVENFHAIVKHKVASKKIENQGLSGFVHSDSDEEIEKLVGLGVNSCIQAIKQAQVNHQIPYSICLLLSLDAE